MSSRKSGLDETTRRIRAVLSRHTTGHAYAFALVGGPHPNDREERWVILVVTKGGERLPLTADLVEALDRWDGVLHMQGSVPCSLYINQDSPEPGPLSEVGLQMMPLTPGSRGDGGNTAADLAVIVEAEGIGESRPPVFTARERPVGWPW